jgi:hypothetical protein
LPRGCERGSGARTGPRAGRTSSATTFGSGSPAIRSHFELEALFFSPAGYAVAYRRSVARRSLDVVEWGEKGLARSIVVFDDDARQG